MNTPRNTPLLRSVEDLADAKDLRSAITAALTEAPMNDQTLRRAVWSFVGNERRAGVPPALVITRLTGLVEDAKFLPMALRPALTRRVILWCVEEYFGHLGGDAVGMDSCRSEEESPVAL